MPEFDADREDVAGDIGGVGVSGARPGDASGGPVGEFEFGGMFTGGI
jgi:hypothetical protein